MCSLSFFDFIDELSVSNDRFDALSNTGDISAVVIQLRRRGTTQIVSHSSASSVVTLAIGLLFSDRCGAERILIENRPTIN